MSSQSSSLGFGVLGHKTRSFLKLFGRNPGAAFRRFRGYFREPLYLFQMGKVGSSTHRNTLQTLYHVYHLHTADDFRAKFRPARRKGETDLITIVREPLGRKLSTFFQNLVDSPYEFSFGSRDEVREAGVDELLERFHGWEDGISEATQWFERHFEPVTGLCVYDHGFDPGRGWKVFHSGEWRVLVLRFEDIATNHVEALNAFVADRFRRPVHFDQLRNSNVSSVKWYSEIMKEFRKRLRYTEEEVDQALGSRYCRYFYTPEERAELRGRWLGPAVDGADGR